MLGDSTTSGTKKCEVSSLGWKTGKKVQRKKVRMCVHEFVTFSAALLLLFAMLGQARFGLCNRQQQQQQQQQQQTAQQQSVEQNSIGQVINHCVCVWFN